jgi:hypothetical protein
VAKSGSVQQADGSKASDNAHERDAGVLTPTSNAPMTNLRTAERGTRVRR